MKVREVIKRLQDDGWTLERQAGSHRQLKHPTKSGLVTVAGNEGDEISKGTLGSIRRQAGLKELR
jgi:predicted RNA binding protein YcfA (HicA-like mRNA interferase family)